MNVMMRVSNPLDVPQTLSLPGASIEGSGARHRGDPRALPDGDLAAALRGSRLPRRGPAVVPARPQVRNRNGRPRAAVDR